MKPCILQQVLAASAALLLPHALVSTSCFLSISYTLQAHFCRDSCTL